MSIVVFLGLTLFLKAISTFASSIDPIVTISNGVIRGRTALTVGSEMIYYAYQGIPYAEPPTENLRFEPPVAKENWSGILNTTQEGSICVQSTNPVLGNENCLFLNIYTTEAPGSNASRSTMVYIQGEGYIFNDNKYINATPDYLLEEGVVFVSIQYRVGIFGFLSSGDTVAPGNYGMKDQVLALKWVRHNVANFGGNPNDITIFGAGLGASSVSYHRQSPLSQGLFHKVIMNSGVTLCSFSFCRDVPKLVQATADKLGISTVSSPVTVPALKRVNYSDLQTAASDVVKKHAHPLDPTQSLGFCTVIEPVHPGAFITESSRQMLLNGDFAPVPALVGYNTREASTALSFFRPAFLRWYLLLVKVIPVGMHLKSFLDKVVVGNSVRNKYFGEYTSTISDENTITFLSDHLFNRPIMQYIKLTHSIANVYFYIFGYRGQMGGNLNKTSTGVAHAEELRYIFVSPFLSTNSTDITIRNQMVAMWTNFVKHGNPTPTVKQNVLDGITWTPSDANFTHLTINNDVLIATNPQETVMKYWDDLFEKYENPPADTY